MFEGSLIKNSRTRAPAGIAIAVAGQVSAISLAVLIPLVYTEHLPAFTTPASIAVPKGKPDPAPAEIKSAPKGAQVVRAKRPNPFIAPRGPIPSRIPVLIDEPPPLSAGQDVPGAAGSAPTSASGPRPPMSIVTPPAPKSVEPKPASAPPPIKRVKVGGAVQAAQIIKRVIPVYPPLAKQARIQGTVKLLGIIATDGAVKQMRVISGHPLLVQAAVDAVRQWIYRPTLLNGEPVEVEAPIDVKFTLAQ